MNLRKRVMFTFVGVLGGLIYFRRDMHRWYYINVERKPAESYDPDPIKKIL